MGNNIAAPQETETNPDYSGKTWVVGKAEPISPRVAASLGEPILGGHKNGPEEGCPSER